MRRRARARRWRLCAGDRPRIWISVYHRANAARLGAALDAGEIGSYVGVTFTRIPR